MATLITSDVKELKEPILARLRQRSAAGANTPMVVMILGRAACGKSTAAGILKRLLEFVLGLDVVAHIEDDFWLVGKAVSVVRGWSDDYRFDRVEEQILSAARDGRIVQYAEEDWVTHKVLCTVTLDRNVQIILLVGRFPRKFVEEYSHFTIWVECTSWESYWRGMWRSIRGLDFAHIFRWHIWVGKDDQDIIDEHTHDLADAVYITSKVRSRTRSRFAGAA